jgi:hypothetical protein
VIAQFDRFWERGNRTQSKSLSICEQQAVAKYLVLDRTEIFCYSFLMKSFFISFAIFFAAASIADAKHESKESTPSGAKIRTNESNLKIVRRASEILSLESSWNKKDNRNCPPNAKTFSLYCALCKASIEINGEFDHRLGALEEVRRTVEENSKGKNYEHRLMGYNNDGVTSFDDIKRVLKSTEQRLLARAPK